MLTAVSTYQLSMGKTLGSIHSTEKAKLKKEKKNRWTHRETQSWSSSLKSCDRTCCPCCPSAQGSSGRMESGQESYTHNARGYVPCHSWSFSLSLCMEGLSSWLYKVGPSMLPTNGRHRHLPLATTTPNRNPARPHCHPQRPKFPEWFDLGGAYSRAGGLHRGWARREG